MALTTKSRLDVRPLASALGAEIFGVNLAESLDDDTIETLREALLEHVVIFFRDQELTPQRLLALAERFGEPAEYPLIKGLPECPLVLPVIKEPHERSNFGGIWHSDTAYLERPALGSLLYALETPPVGGDTMSPVCDRHIRADAVRRRTPGHPPLSGHCPLPSCITQHSLVAPIQ